MSESPLPHVELYTDGSCSGNPGPGGWAFILKHPASGKTKEVSGGEVLTTNNRMELTAAIEGLGMLKTRSIVDLFSDSKYVLDGIKTWIHDWKKRGWKTKAKEPVKNVDLWQKLDEAVSKHDVRFHWVKGHNEHPENDLCDRLAVAASLKFKGKMTSL